MWLSIPTAGKLQSRWEGMWIVKAIKSEVNLEISDGVRTKIVHVNRIHHRLQPQPGDDASPADDSEGHNSWVPPQIDHFIDEIGVPDRNDDTLNAQETCLSVMAHFNVMLVDKLNLERAYVAPLYVLLRMHIQYHIQHLCMIGYRHSDMSRFPHHLQHCHFLSQKTHCLQWLMQTYCAH